MSCTHSQEGHCSTLARVLVYLLPLQIANYLEFGPDDSEADRKKALTEVVELGQNVWVKVSVALGVKTLHVQPGNCGPWNCRWQLVAALAACCHA